MRLKQLTQPFIFLLCIVAVQAGVFLYIAIRPFYLTPPNHTYTVLGKNYLYPIFYYPSMILQSKDGAWGIKDSATTAPQSRPLTQWFFIIAGKIDSLFNIAPTTYILILQFIGGIAVLVATYAVIVRILPKSYHLAALFFTLAMEIGPRGLNALGLPAIDSQELILRHFGLPHHIWGEAFGLLSFLLLILCYQKNTLTRLVGLFVSSLLATAFLPPYMFTLAISVYPALFIWSLENRTAKKSIIPLIIGATAIAVMAIQTKLAFAHAGLPWTTSNAVEKTWWTNHDILLQYGLSFLPYTPFFVFLGLSLPFVWRKLSEITRLIIILMAAWILIPCIFIPISGYSFFPVANFRLVDGYQYVAAGILAAIGFIECLNGIKNKAVQKMFLTVIMTICVGASILLCTTYLTPFLKSQESLDPHAYPTTATWKGIQFLQTVPKQSGILVTENFGEIITGFANVRVYIGGQHGFPDWLARQWLANRFYSGTLPQTDASDFLKSNDISYVFYGPDERRQTQTPSLYPDLLKPVFENTDVAIYTVK